VSIDPGGMLRWPTSCARIFPAGEGSVGASHEGRVLGGAARGSGAVGGCACLGGDGRGGRRPLGTKIGIVADVNSCERDGGSVVTGDR
jgi:hypothetical protein